MPKRPEKPVSVDRRNFFRHLFVKAVEKVEEAGREFAHRVAPQFQQPAPPPVYQPPSYAGWAAPKREKYGPPWPPPYGPPVPQHLKDAMKARSHRAVSQSYDPHDDPAVNHPDMTD